MNIPNELTPELRAAYNRHRAREATEDDLLNMALFEAHGALHSLPPHCLPAEGGMPYNEDHANCCAHRCLSFLRELYLVRVSLKSEVFVLSSALRQIARNTSKHEPLAAAFAKGVLTESGSDEADQRARAVLSPMKTE